ncbi:MAG: carboxypeptidase regulatory-like domain-containing protein [Bacteroidetes bacterium]|nr:carboxypeptidase regulatory-like domain-containing protein [Bacteroidota bacterium]
MNFEQMPEVDGGRFCNVCVKVVRDFTKMSDEELIKFIQKKGKEEMCGMFRPEQMREPSYWQNWKNAIGYAAAMFVGMFTLTNKINANIRVNSIPGEENKKVFTISGIVEKEHHYKPIPGAAVFLYDNNGNELGETITDERGEFSLVVSGHDSTEIFHMKFSAGMSYEYRYTGSLDYKTGFMLIIMDRHLNGISLSGKEMLAPLPGKKIFHHRRRRRRSLGGKF